MKVQVIRTDGTEEDHEIPVSFAAIEKLIGASCTDSVNLGDGSVMIVDDNGYDTETVDHGGGHFELKCVRARKPVNAKATQLYLAICVPGTTHQIVGDVAIALDADFARP